jgi:hypothetical protein
MHAHRPLPAGTEPTQAIAVLPVPGKTPSGTSVGLCSGQRLQRQVGALVGNALDLPCRGAEQLMSQVGQGPRGRDLLADLRDLRVIRITAGKAVADHVSAVPGQPRLGPRLPVFLAE